MGKNTLNKKRTNKNVQTSGVMGFGMSDAAVDLAMDDIVKKDAGNLNKDYGAMVEAIAAIISEKGACNRDDLKAAGFSAREIKDKWAMAFALASVQSAKVSE